MTKYNGWTNYETWLVNLHYDNFFQEQAEDLYQDALACDTFSKEENAAHALCEYIEETVTEFNYNPDADTALVNDIVNAALSSVNWYEIAANYIESLGE